MQHVQVTQWGNSLGFRIPRGIATSLDIHMGDTLVLTPAKDGLLVKKAAPASKRYALHEVLDSFAPASVHAAVNFGPPQGEEVW